MTIATRAASVPGPVPPTAHAWATLALLAVAVLLGMSVWFTAGAIAPRLGAEWGLGAQHASWLVTSVQLGFVAGTALAALLNLADIVPDRRYFAVSAALAAVANGALLAAPGPASALVTRFLTGFFLAGVYPPAMKMAATWFRSARGLAIGVIVGALTIGKATPYLVGAIAVLDPTIVVLTGSAAALLAALLIAVAYRAGPFPFERRAFDLALVGVVLRDRPTRLAIGGYLGHMWELYAMWALIVLYFLDALAAGGTVGVTAARTAGVATFAAIAVGGVGCVVAGRWADRFGREEITIVSMATSGACALVAGWITGAPLVAVVALALVWGFAIVADSAQFSALVTEVCPRHAVGTALTLQTSIGFALTAVSIAVCAWVAERYGWGPAFSMLAVGPALGIRAMIRLRALRSGTGVTEPARLP